MSRANSVGVLPAATMSSTKGREMRPSGRTGTPVEPADCDDDVELVEISGLRQTNTCSVSPIPILYSLDATAGETGGAGRPVSAHPARARPEISIAALP